jgi:hypothetical protein
MMALEIPGIYLRTDIDRLYVFDAVRAKVLSRGPHGVKLEITNPTKFDARVSVFGENAAQARQPERTIAFLKWRKIEVKAGETIVARLAPDGTLTLVSPSPLRASPPHSGL